MPNKAERRKEIEDRVNQAVARLIEAKAGPLSLLTDAFGDSHQKLAISVIVDGWTKELLWKEIERLLDELEKSDA